VNMKTLRVIWIGIGVLALLATLRAFVLSQHAGSTRAIWTNLLAVAFALTILVSTIFSNRSLAARRILATCWVVTVVYCVAFMMLVGLEFGALWLVVAISVGALSTVSIWIMRRQMTSKSQSL
jgi:hypothetical protein